MDNIRENKELTLTNLEDVTKDNYKDLLPIISDNVRKLVNLKNMNMSNLALAMCMDRRTIKKMAVGDIDKIRFHTAKKINDCFNNLYKIIETN